MNLARTMQIAKIDLLHNIRRPLYWILVIVLFLSAWGLSTGTLQISSGDSHVGGTKAWITSEFAITQMLGMIVFIFYIFFAAIASGMPVIADDEMKISELLHSTPLRPAEYIWGKYFAIIMSFLGVLVLHLLSMIFFNHFVPNSRSLEIRGPFDALNYLRPAIFFAFPTLIFLTGISFCIGTWSRRPILLYVIPVALLLACGFFLWSWSPSWLDPRINKLLMLVDPSGFRWLSETWLKSDKGVNFYNHARVEYSLAFSLSRIVLACFGLLCVFAAQITLVSSMRGASKTRKSKFRFTSNSNTPEKYERLEATDSANLGSLQMTTSQPGFFQSLWHVTKVELRELRSQPGLYLFIPIIILQTVTSSSLAVGAFDTPLLSTAGTLAVAAMNPLTLMVCLLLMFYTVESLQRDPTTGTSSILFAAPVRTSALLFGKALANSAVGVFILLANLLTCLTLLAIQGIVPVQTAPFLIIWGLLLIPTFLLWTTFITATFSVTGNRYTTLGIGLAVMIFTIYRALTKEMNWLGNWMLWSSIHWSDLGILEMDRRAILLNRFFILSLTLFFVVVAVKFFRRREPDPGRLLTRFYPAAVFGTGLRLLPYALPALILGVMLYGSVYDSYEGDVVKKALKDYWRKNHATWTDAVLPNLNSMDVQLEIEPNEAAFRVTGSYEIRNDGEKPIRLIPLTVGPHWQDLSWTMNGKAYQPEDRSLLCVFTPEAELTSGKVVRIGFSYTGHLPKGISKNGGGISEFISPAGIVLTSFTPSFLPVLGYASEIGVDKDNKHEQKEYPDDYYKQRKEPAFGSNHGYSTRFVITAPESFTMNAVGVRVSESVQDGKKTVEWRSDHPVRFCNVVGGKWDVKEGQGTKVYYYPGHPFNIQEISETLDASRKYYSEWFYPYPWKELKLSEFPAYASYAQGFPTNITFSEAIGFLTQNDSESNATFMVTAHEAAHQWWGNILTPGKGTNADLLSEGMAHFSTALLFEQIKGPRGRIQFLKQIESQYEQKRRRDSERPLVKIDGSQDGDTTVIYDKGGWVFWMMLQQLGREAMLQGIRQFIKQYHDGPDYPLLQNFVEFMRKFATDKPAYDAFTKQWFYEVVVPEYRLSDGLREVSSNSPEEWVVKLKITNAGTGTAKIDVAATTGDRFDKEGKQLPDYRDARIAVVLGAGESREVSITCKFKPTQVIVDPDALILQLGRKSAILRF